MASNEEGEFELALGSKQLLGVFFVVVLLLGVFFTMGYIVARSLGPKPVDVAMATEAEPPVVVEQPPAPDPGAERPSPAGAPKEPEPVAATPKKEPAPAPAPTPAPVKPTPPAAVPTAKPLPPPVEGAPLRAGTYFQVSAIEKKGAELLADVLRKKGFPSALQSVPEKALMRVLVGPIKDADEIAKVRAGLVAAGFQPIIKKL
jgi:cell division protein FtsN